jgi:undecaprenyl diphosphate synthase
VSADGAVPEALEQRDRRAARERRAASFIGDRLGIRAAARAHALPPRRAPRTTRADAAGRVNYGGRWDILKAARQLARALRQGAIRPAEISEDDRALPCSWPGLPDPDLFIRTGGEQRISNFLLWHLAYTELYFCATLWPDFDAALLEEAFASYRARERRFGRTSEQLAGARAKPLPRAG